MARGKRGKSPKFVDEAQYFTVNQPYPLSPKWFDEEDQIACAQWVAECIGPDHLWAIHTKPRVSMILLEVSREFTDHKSLLGEHRWSEFLKEATLEESLRVSQVFYSFYATGSDVKKDGWKVIPVKREWLSDWKPGSDRIVQPYPTTHWCHPPSEDRTTKSLCRPLPAYMNADYAETSGVNDLSALDQALQADDGPDAPSDDLIDQELDSDASESSDGGIPNNDDASWGARKGGNEIEWGFKLQHMKAYEHNNISEFHTWEKGGPHRTPAAPLQEAATVEPRLCPTHNYRCKKSMCLDMARVLREEELKETEKQKTSRKKKGGKQKAVEADDEGGEGSDIPVRAKKPPQRQRKKNASNNGYRPAGRAPYVNKNRHMEVNPKPQEGVSSPGVSNAWGAPIATKTNLEWGIQVSLNEWS